MKKILILLILFPLITGATYYTKNNGNDTLSGLDDDNAWLSFTKIENSTTSNDTILLKNGSTWRDTLDIPYSYMTFSTYGEGDSPKIYGSNAILGESGDWTDEGSNVWYRSLSNTSRLVVFDSDIRGVNNETIDGQYDWYYNSTTQRLRVYSEGNPTAYYTSIEAGQRDYCINGGNRTSIIVDGLDIRYNNAAYGGALDLRNPANSNWIVSNMNFGWSSSMGFLCMADDSTIENSTFKSGFFSHENSNNVTFNNNGISGLYGNGLSIGGDNGTYSNNTITNNWYNGIFLFIYSSYNKIIGNNVSLSGQAPSFGDGTQRFEIYSSGSDNNNITNNYIHDGSTSGAGGGGIYLDDGSENNNITHNTIVNITGTSQGYALCVENGIPKNSTYRTRNNTFKNNIVKDCNLAVGFANDFSTVGYLNNVFDYNLYNGSITHVVYDGAGNAAYDTLSDWQIATSQDLHSISQDPLISSTGFPYTNSPAVDAGTDVGITTDYRGVSRSVMYDGDLPDIGAYERKTYQPTYIRQTSDEWNTTMDWYRDSQ